MSYIVPNLLHPNLTRRLNPDRCSRASMSDCPSICLCSSACLCLRVRLYLNVTRGLDKDSETDGGVLYLFLGSIIDTDSSLSCLSSLIIGLTPQFIPISDLFLFLFPYAPPLPPNHPPRRVMQTSTHTHTHTSTQTYRYRYTSHATRVHACATCMQCHVVYNYITTRA